MSNNFTRIENVLNNGYELEFGTVLDKAFNNFKKIFGVAGLGLIVITIFIFAIMMALIAVFYGFSDIATSFTKMNPNFLHGTQLYVFLFITIIGSALFSPINAGFIRMAYLADKGEHFGLETLFYYFKTKYFKDIFIATILISLITVISSELLKQVGFNIIGLLLTYFVYFLTFLTIPLIIFSDLDAIKAINYSIKLVLKNPLLILGLLIVAAILSMLGFIAFCIGVFFSLPMIYSMYYCIYNEILPINHSKELDEIGKDN